VKRYKLSKRNNYLLKKDKIMNSKQKFKNFLESLKKNGNEALIESVKKGFQVCFEAKYGDSTDDKLKMDDEEIDEEYDKWEREMNEIATTEEWMSEREKKREMEMARADHYLDQEKDRKIRSAWKD
jgi:hypothetical protein